MRAVDEDAGVQGVLPHNRCPGWMVPHVFERVRTLPVDRGALWRWLNTPETFTRQVWPYRVEFLEGSGVGGASGFGVGVLNTHHGPLLNCAGVMTRVDAWDDGSGELVRDLRYCYGAFIVSPRLIRPTLLRFAVRDDGGGASLTLRVECWVRPWCAGVWTRLQSVFWSGFFAGARRGAARAEA
ncbi:MAG: hypothetical protein AAGH64_05310 [Planctomycetota bacterium]